jgi:hypothetical protein
MRIARTGMVLVLATAATSAMATPVYSTTFTVTYSLKPGTRLASVPCAACHVGTEAPLNAYGKDIKAAMKKAGSMKLTSAVLISTNNLDSDKDGYTNVQEIKVDHKPGDPKDTPKGHYPPKKSSSTGAKPAPKK